jgi:serine/threonine protein kinase, bacterial
VTFAARLATDFEAVPGYRLGRFLGKGGWGEVWQATREDGTAIALKFLPCDSQLAAAQEIRALQTIRQLKHPSLIHIEQIWSIADYVVVGMELADGSLADLLDVYYTELRQPIPPDHVCYYLRQAASALDFLNARQHQLNGQRVAVRHCDVKPSNLLVVGNDVKLADFSLAVQATSSILNHRRVGTWNYLAPELFRGILSDRTDQYSLAITYCQLRTGRLPFPDLGSGKVPKTKTYSRPAPDLSTLSAPERPIIARALGPVPQDRWHSCTELIERLSNCLAQTEEAVPA